MINGNSYVINLLYLGFVYKKKKKALISKHLTAETGHLSCSAVAMKE